MSVTFLWISWRRRVGKSLQGRRGTPRTVSSGKTEGDVVRERAGEVGADSGTNDRPKIGESNHTTVVGRERLSFRRRERRARAPLAQLWRREGTEDVYELKL
jgi:hypothetical protein